MVVAETDHQLALINPRFMFESILFVSKTFYKMLNGFQLSFRKIIIIIIIFHLQLMDSIEFELAIGINKCC